MERTHGERIKIAMIVATIFRTEMFADTFLNCCSYTVQIYESMSTNEQIRLLSFQTMIRSLTF